MPIIAIGLTALCAIPANSTCMFILNFTIITEWERIIKDSDLTHKYPHKYIYIYRVLGNTMKNDISWISFRVLFCRYYYIILFIYVRFRVDSLCCMVNIHSYNYTGLSVLYFVLCSENIFLSVFWEWVFYWLLALSSIIISFKEQFENPVQYII